MCASAAQHISKSQGLRRKPGVEHEPHSLHSLDTANGRNPPATQVPKHTSLGPAWYTGKMEAGRLQRSPAPPQALCVVTAPARLLQPCVSSFWISTYIPSAYLRSQEDDFSGTVHPKTHHVESTVFLTTSNIDSLLSAASVNHSECCLNPWRPAGAGWGWVAQGAEPSFPSTNTHVLLSAQYMRLSCPRNVQL